MFDVKYLGIILDSKLNWSKRLEHVTKKLRKLNYLFYYLTQYFTSSHIHHLYLAFYQPILSYGVMHSGGAADYHVKPLDTLQRSILKIVASKNPEDTRRRDLPLKCRQLSEVNLLNFVFKNRNIFKIITRGGKTRTANDEVANIPPFKKYHTRMQSMYASAVLYNHLPQVEMETLWNYKRRRKYLCRYVADKGTVARPVKRT